MQVTKEQKAKLLLAIEKAELPGDCQYAADGKPRCVIAQLATLEGVSFDALREWDGHGKVANIFENECRGREKLESYPLGLLTQLQNLWDSTYSVCSVDGFETRKLREMLRNVVEEVPCV